MKKIRILFKKIVITIYYEHIESLNTMLHDLIHTEDADLIENGIIFSYSELDEVIKYRLNILKCDGKRGFRDGG